MSKVPNIEPSWAAALHREFEQSYFAKLRTFLVSEREKHTVYPKGKDIFAAFDNTPFDQVKVVILGQDPYHGPKQAHGLCFSVAPGVSAPPSLVNIFKELGTDIGIDRPGSGDLTSWAAQGVLLLNATLTVRASEAASHQGQGWELFTDAAISKLSDEHKGLVFLLWGASARKKVTLVDEKKHYVLQAPHPSPLSAHRGFLGCKHFSKTNDILLAQGKQPIDWSLA